MGTLEQVKLLESKVVKAIAFVKRLTEENDQLKDQLDSYQKRVDELEALIQGFREEQGRVEEGIRSTLNRLNQFESAIDKSLSPLARVSSEDVPSDDKVPSDDEVPSNDEILSGLLSNAIPSSELLSDDELPPDDVLAAVAEYLAPLDVPESSEPIEVEIMDTLGQEQQPPESETQPQ
jgi:FtsZ-binding cell division protein ZapB